MAEAILLVWSCCYNTGQQPNDGWRTQLPERTKISSVFLEASWKDLGCTGVSERFRTGGSAV